MSKTFTDIFGIEPLKLSGGNAPFTPADPGNWNPPPTNVDDAINQLAGLLPLQNGFTVVLAGLYSAGIWFPLEYVGPTFAHNSTPTPTGYGNGCGFFQVPCKGVLSNFRWTNASAPGSPIPADVYIAPSGNPGLLAYSGVSLTMGAGNTISANTVDTLVVNPGDIIVLYNPSPFIGYTPSGMTITAQLFPTN